MFECERVIEWNIFLKAFECVSRRKGSSEMERVFDLSFLWENNWYFGGWPPELRIYGFLFHLISRHASANSAKFYGTSTWNEVFLESYRSILILFILISSMCMPFKWGFTVIRNNMFGRESVRNVCHTPKEIHGKHLFYFKP